MTDGAGGGFFHLVDEGLGIGEGQADAEEVGFALVRVFIVAAGECRDDLQQDCPGRVFAEEFFVEGFGLGDFDYGALGASTDLKEDNDGFGGIEGASGIVVGERGQERFDLGESGGDGVPPVAIAVVDNCATRENFVDAFGVFAGDADDHVGEFVEAEVLFDDRANGDEAGVFFGVADRDLIGERHGRNSLRRGRSKSIVLSFQWDEKKEESEGQTEGETRPHQKAVGWGGLEGQF